MFGVLSIEKNNDPISNIKFQMSNKIRCLFIGNCIVDTGSIWHLLYPVKVDKSSSD